MSAIALQPADCERERPVAPFWHTALLVAVIGALAVGGALFQHWGGNAPTSGDAPHGSHIPLYLSLLAAEFGLFTFARKGSAMSGTSVRDLIGQHSWRARDLARDLLLGAALWGGWQLIEHAWDRLFGAGQATSIASLLPRGPVEMVLWVAVSLSAGFCEEVAFRGYCQRQFAALTHSRWLGVLLQALLFGIGHGYEGLQSCLRIALYGALFGCLALWRKSLRPGMFAHAGSDIIAGLFGF